MSALLIEYNIFLSTAIITVLSMGLAYVIMYFYDLTIDNSIESKKRKEHRL